MGRSIVLASGKGGTGKTTVAINLGIALASAGKKTVVVDADVAMANVGILLGIERAPISLHNVLMGEADVKDAVYEGPAKLRYVPAALSLDKYAKVDFERLRDAVKELAGDYDFVIVDCAPGLAKDAREAIKAAKEAILVINPEPASLADGLKVKAICDREDVKLIGVIVNAVTGDRSEIKKVDLETIIGAPVIQELPEDKEVRKASALQEPVIIRKPDAPFSRGVRELARKVSGGAIPEPRIKKGVFSSILAAFGIK
ncbi:MAG: cell division ATPase MinD [Candidatus Micrarchaeota archaeon]|nr:cell division ATPase MinD [Candidatus Micrarchaeota archaeon]